MHRHMTNRRDFLTGVAGFLAARAANAEHNPNFAFPTDAHSRIAITSYSFRDLFKKNPAMTLVEFAEFTQSTFGVRNIEPLYSHIGATDADHLSRLRENLDRQHVRIVDISASVQASFYDPNPSNRMAAIEQGKSRIDTAAALNALSVRLHVRRCAEAKPDVALTAKSLRPIVDYGASRNVIVNLENDDLESEDAFFLVDVIREVGSPFLRALPDFGNSVRRSPDFSKRALRAMFPYACNVTHVKDELIDSGRLYRPDVQEGVQIARRAGYRGYFSMEWEGQGDPVSGTKNLIQKTLTALA